MIFQQNKTNSGIITNLPSTEVAWATGRNVRFVPGAVYKKFGSTSLATRSLPVRGLFTFKGFDDVFRSVACFDTKIESGTNNFTAIQTITPASAPTSGINDVWQFAMVGGQPIFTNGINIPSQWTNFANILTPLTNAPICKAIASHKGRVIAGYISEGGFTYPARVRWSNIHAPTDWTLDLKGMSGYKDLIPVSANVDAIDGIKSITNDGDTLVVFCGRNIWLGAFNGGVTTYNWKALDQGLGLVAPRAYVKTTYGQIYFMSQEDFYILGDTPKPIGFQIRNAVFPNLNKAAINTAFAYYRQFTKEVVFCFATGTNTVPDTEVVYQEETKAWSIGDCNYTVASINYDSSNFQWSTLPYGSWTAITDGRWDEIGDTGVIPYQTTGNSSGVICKQDDGYNNYDSTPISAYIETGDFRNDDFNHIVINTVEPVVKPQTPKNALMVKVGARRTLSDPIQWSLPQPFYIGTGEHVKFHHAGKYVRLRFESNVIDSPWTLEGFHVDLRIGARR